MHRPPGPRGGQRYRAAMEIHRRYNSSSFEAVTCAAQSTSTSAASSTTVRRPLSVCPRLVTEHLVLLAGPYQPELTEAAQRKASNYSGFVYDFNKGPVGPASTCGICSCLMSRPAPPA